MILGMKTENMYIMILMSVEKNLRGKR